jgi:hypothetical protein
LVEHTTENRGVGGSIPPLTTTPTLVLLCAPSMGILDNWLPVLHAARASHPDRRIVALIPDRATLAQLDPEDTAHVLADEVIDATVVPLVGGDWIQTEGFLAAPAAAAPRRLLRRLPTRAQRRASIDISALDGATSSLLYDIHLHEKSGLAPVLARFDRASRFSQNHGLILEQLGERKVPLPSGMPDPTVFAFGRDEIRAYVENFGLSETDVEVVGIPRHTERWIATVVERSRATHSIPFHDCVFVISRPAGSPYLPRERKVRALRDLHEIAWVENGLPLLIRTHPKEAQDGTLREALPPSEQGRSWALTGAHPFHISMHATVAVAFFSGVVIDTVALGVPTIEFLDVRGIPEYDHPEAPLDSRGRPTFGPYRKDGLVLPADDIEDLRATFGGILADRQAVAACLSA